MMMVIVIDYLLFSAPLSRRDVTRSWPKVGMEFEGLDAVEEFYKSYAHHVGFGVRVRQQKKLDNNVVRTKRFM